MSKSKRIKTGYSLAVFLTLVLVGAAASAKKAEIVDVTITANVSPFFCTLFGQTGASPATVSFRLDTSAPIFIPAGTQIGPFANDLIFTDLYGYQKNALSAISASYGNKTWDDDDVSDGPLGGYAPNPSATVWFNGPVTAGGTAIPTIVFDDSDGRLVPAPLACGLNEWGGGCGLLDRIEVFEIGMMGVCDGIGSPLQVEVVSAANKPDFVVTYPSGFACDGFDLQIEGWFGKQHIKEFKDKNGLLVRALSAGTGAALRYTNLTTGQTFSSKSNGAVSHTTYNPDGSLTLKLTGHNVVILFPTDIPPGPSTTLYVGRVVISIDTSGNYTVQEESGNKTDICAAVSQ